MRARPGDVQGSLRRLGKPPGALPVDDEARQVPLRAVVASASLPHEKNCVHPHFCSFFFVSLFGFSSPVY